MTEEEMKQIKLPDLSGLKSIGESLKRLNDERLAEIEMKKKAAWPVTVSNAKKQCQEMIDKLNKVLEDGYEFSEDAIRRIRDGHFDICTVNNPRMNSWA